MANSSFKFFSGVAAFSIYIILVSLIVYEIVDKKNSAKIYTFEQETIYEITLEEFIEEKVEEKKVVVEKKEKKIEEIKKDEVESSKTPIAGVGIESLFKQIEANVPSQNKEVVSSIDDELARRVSSVTPKQRDIDEKSVDSIIERISVSDAIAFSNSLGEFDEYYSEIQKMLIELWRPRAYSTNLKSKVLITITNSGKFDYRVLEKSNNSRFDSELIEALNKMRNIQFPPYQKGSKTDIDVIFKTEG